MKKQSKVLLFLAICIILSSVAFTSCGESKTKFVSYSLDFFDTATTITGYEKNKADFDKTSGQILELLGEYHKLFTIYQRFEGINNLCTINDLSDGEHKTVSVDKRIIDMLLYAKEMYALTDGKVNIAMGSVLSIWHDYRSQGMNEPWNASLPPMEKLYDAAEHTDINGLLIDEENCTVRIDDPKMKLDVGAIAKGYAVEMAARHLEEMGISGYVINVGGNVRAVGTKPDGEKWLAGIENPNKESEESYIEYIRLDGETVVTSGSYQRFYTVGDINYHHIIDTETLMPAKGYLSVSVICRDSALADALSTALFCMDYERGLSLVESLGGVEAVWVFEDESRKYSSGFPVYKDR